MVYDKDGDPAEVQAYRASNGGHAAVYPTVGGAERILSTAAGGALVGYGLMRRNVGGAFAAAAGAALLVHGLRRTSTIYHALGLTGDEADDGSASFWSTPLTHDVRACAVMTINRSADDLYREWLDLARQPRYFDYLEQVEIVDGTRSRWRARGPLGKSIEWDADLTADEPGRRIAWRSVNSTLFDHAGEVRFEGTAGFQSEPSPSGRGQGEGVLERHKATAAALTPRPSPQGRGGSPAGRGTRVSLELRWSPPAGAVGAMIARFLPQDPHREVREGLRRFKQWMETGEIATGEMRCAERIAHGDV